MTRNSFVDAIVSWQATDFYFFFNFERMGEQSFGYFIHMHCQFVVHFCRGR